MDIILASGSPRRKELMTLAGIPFRVIVSDASEIISQHEPGKIVEELSLQKACAAAKRLPRESSALLIGADTIVYIDGKVLGKPESREDAEHMLRLLSGRAHSVFTGVSLLEKNGEQLKTHQFHCETKVHVAPLSQQEIVWYIDTGDPMDKAGSYGIQGPFARFIEGIEGDYQNVVGLPVAALYAQLKRLGYLHAENRYFPASET